MTDERPRTSVSEADQQQHVETVRKRYWSQWLAAVILSNIMLLVGLVHGWSSPYFAKIKVAGNDEGFLLTEDETSWLASLTHIARIVGVFVGTFGQELIGLKFTLLIAGLPMMCGWVCIAVATNLEWLYASQICCGVTIGIAWTSMPHYLSEIADPAIRGSLVLLNVTLMTTGIFIGNVMGPYILMREYAYICLLFNVIYILSFAFMPDSPYKFIMSHDMKKAEKSLVFFRRTKNVKEELLELEDYINSSKSSCNEKLEEFKQKKSLKSFLLMFIMNIFMFFSANYVITTYMQIIVEKSQIKTDASMVVSVTGFVAILSGILSTILVDIFGRRFLLLSSSFGMTLSLAGLGLHFLLVKELGIDPTNLVWLPWTSLLIYKISFASGISSIPNALVGELFSPRLKAAGSLAYNVVNGGFNSLSTGTFEPMSNLIGYSYTFWFYAAGNLVSVIYYWRFLPETKGKKLKDIQQEDK